MWLSLAGIPKRRLGLSSEMLRSQNQKRSHRKVWDMSSMFVNIRPTNDHKTATSHQDHRRKSVLEVMKKNQNNPPLFTCSDLRMNLRRITQKIEDYEEKLETLQQLKGELINNLRSKDTGEDLVDSWLSEEFPWSDEVNLRLFDTFRLKKLKPTQVQTINATLSNKDAVVIMATGEGKSLCYQLPALLSKGITLVISPLLSLMEDQVMSLRKLGIDAEFLSSTSETETVLKVHDALESNATSLKLLYITPEKFAKSNKFVAQLYKCYEIGNLSRIAIDEVHCVAQWGNSFRPDYKALGTLKQLFPDVPILGLSGTCTTQCLKEVKEVLSIPRALLFQSGLSRRNLFYEVRTKSNQHNKVIEDIATTINDNFSGKSGIVYCLSRRNCEVVCQDLKSHGINCAVYHAQISAEEKHSVHRKWLNNDIQVICATSAFGMGIDKPDVRFVIHHSMCKNMDVYYQECGRAGRDGLPALCLLYHGFSDVARANSLVFRDQHGLKNFAEVLGYCHNTKRCRHEMVMKHFGEEENCCSKMCDLCNGFYQSNVCDVTARARVIMDIVQSSASKGEGLTGVQLVNACRKKTRDGKSESEIHRIITHMLFSSYIKQEFHPSYKTITYIRPGRRARCLDSDKVIIDLPLPTRRRDNIYKIMMEKRLSQDRKAAMKAVNHNS